MSATPDAPKASGVVLHQCRGSVLTIVTAINRLE